MKTGDWIYYFNESGENVTKNDTVEYYRLISYNKGIPTGPFEEFYLNGNRKTVGTIVSENPYVYEGKLTLYRKNGTISKLTFYENGKEIKDKTIVLYEEELSNWPDDKRGEIDFARFLRNLARLYRIDGQFSNAEKLSLEIIEIYKDTYGEQNTNYATSLNYLANIYKEMGRYSDAEKLYLQCREIYKYELGEKHSYYATSLNNLALIYYDMGNYSESERLFERSSQIYKQTLGEDHRYYALSKSNLAGVYTEMGRYEEAEMMFATSRELFKVTWGVQHPYYGGLLKNLASLYQTMKRYEEAEKLYLESLEIRKNALGEEHPHYAVTLNSLANMYEETGRFSDAKKLYLDSREIYRKSWGKDHPYYALSLYNLAKINQTIDQKNDSIESFLQEAIAINQNVYGQNNKNVIEVKKQLARFYYQNGQTEQALVEFLQVLDFYQDYLASYFDYLGEKEREAFYMTIKDNFEEFYQLTFRETINHPELLSIACNLQLEQKAFLLKTSNQIKKRIVASGDRKLIDLYDEVESLRQRLGQIQSLNDDQQINFAEERDSLVSLLRQKDQLLTQYSTYYRKIQSPTTWETVRDNLLKNEALVEIVRFREFEYRYSKFTDKVKYGAFIISGNTKDQPDFILFPEGNFLEDKAIIAYQNSIEHKTEDELSYNAFWLPIKEKLKKADNVYISSDGVFNQINLQTLYNPDKDQYLFEELDLHMITSGKELMEEKRDPLPNKYGLLIGNPDFGEKPNFDSNDRSVLNLYASIERGSLLSPLPGTEEEVSEISILLKENQWRYQTYTGKEAKEGILKEMLKPKVLHIATHGYFQKDVKEGSNYVNNPLFRSGLLLSGSSQTFFQSDDVRANIQMGKEDGILTAFEAMNLNIDNTDLVVLSACETGLGEIRNGEGVYGLQRAFKEAGARSILMSLWKVNDQTTRELMVNFYKNWLNGQTKREAFKNAQILLKNKHPHPYYWGAFVLVGE